MVHLLQSLRALTTLDVSYLYPAEVGIAQSTSRFASSSVIPTEAKRKGGNLHSPFLSFQSY